MAGRRDDDYLDADSDSGGSFIVDDREAEKGAGRGGKGKAKRASKRKEKGKGKTKEVCVVYDMTCTRIYNATICSNHTLGKHPILAHGMQCKRTKVEVCSTRLRILWHKAAGEGLWSHVPNSA